MIIIKKEEIILKKWNNLTAIKFSRKNKWGRQIWLFECDCKNKTRKELNLGDVKSGKILSCGCFSKKQGKFSHKLTYHKLYPVWCSIKQRCLNKNNKNYKDYGGRGIKICHEWKNNFKIFYDWAILNGYQQGLTIDRTNNNGNYEPNNCRWITQKEQNNNKRTNKICQM